MSESRPSLLAVSAAHPVLGSTIAGLTAGIVALVLGFTGLPSPYPIVIGLSAVMPIMAVVGLGRSLDLEAYRSARGGRGLAVDAGASVATALIAGSILAVLGGVAALDGSLLAGIALAGTIAGGYGTFAVRTRAFRGEISRGDNG